MISYFPNFDYWGKYCIFLFFSKAFTHGSTKQYIELSKFDEIDIPLKIIGISQESEETLKEYKNKYAFKFDFISDKEKDMAKILDLLKSTGRMSRSTIITDPWGKIRYIWKNISFEGHIKEVTEKLKRIYEEDQDIESKILNRKAYRSFSKKEVSKKVLETLIKSAQLAPSCFNNQPWKYIIVDDKEILQKLQKSWSKGNEWMNKSKAIIIVYTNEEADCKLSDNRNYALFDTGISTGFIMIQATQMGLIAHPVAGFDPLIIKETLNIDKKNIIITAIAIGYPDEEEIKAGGKPRERKDLTEILKWN